MDLANGVETEPTVTPRTAVSRYDFPSDGSSALLFDVAGSRNRAFGSEVNIEDRTVSGWVETASVCDEGGRHRAHFSTTFDRPVKAPGTWQGDETRPGTDSALGGGTRHGAGACPVFDRGAEVTAKTGLSYVSFANAAHNTAAETRGKGFDQVRARCGGTRWARPTPRVAAARNG